MEGFLTISRSTSKKVKPSTTKNTKICAHQGGWGLSEKPNPTVVAQFGLELPGLWDQCLSGVLVLNDPQSTQSPLVTLVVWGESLVFLPSSFHFFSLFFPDFVDGSPQAVPAPGLLMNIEMRKLFAH